jgi:hypothetical protein
VQLTGKCDHPDFADAINMLRASAALVLDSPELIVVAQSRPGEIGSREIERLRRRSPLAGVVALLGSWCEGETRTGRPWPGLERVYWYEFPAWWRRQMALVQSGRCPDWARAVSGDMRCTEYRVLSTEYGVRSRPLSHNGLVVIHVARRDTAEAFSDVLQRAGFSTVWQKPGQGRPVVRGAAAGIWVGGQLSEAEANELRTFCRQMEHEAAPVVAMFDFPRRDCVDAAVKLGATTVLGMPCCNSALIKTLDRQIVTSRRRLAS